MGLKPCISTEDKIKVCLEVCEYVLDMSIREACSKAGISTNSFYRWIVDIPEVREQYARAREAISYSVEPKIEDIIQSVKNEQIKPDAARVIIDAEKWLAGQRNSPVYGKKQDITSGGEKLKSAVIVVATPEDKDILDEI